MDLAELIQRVDLASAEHRLLVDPDTMYSGDRPLSGAWDAYNMAIRQRIQELNAQNVDPRGRTRTRYADITPLTAKLNTPITDLVLRGVRQAHAATRFGGVTPADQAPQPARTTADIAAGTEIYLAGAVEVMRDTALPEEMIEAYLNGDDVFGTVVDVMDNYRVRFEDFGTWWVRRENLEIA